MAKPATSSLNVAALKDLGAKTWANWSGASVPRLAAAFSFYAILSVAPLLVLAVVFAGNFLGGEASAREELMKQAQGAVGKPGADLLNTLIENTAKPATSWIATLLSLGVTFFSASNLFLQLTETINSMWGLKAEGSFIRSFLLARIFAFLAVLIFGVIVLGWLTIDSWLGWIERHTSGFTGWQLVSFAVSFIFLTLVFGASYKVFPKGRVQWSDVWIGATVASLGIGFAKLLLSLYFSRMDVAAAYGPAGALVLILLWIYYTSQIYFFGAEIVFTYTHSYGSRAHLEDKKDLVYS